MNDRPVILGYRPSLDGVRALAILLVVGFHAFHWPAVGWLGVDVFFVLSGFLITTLLLDEHRARGHVSLSSFYVRRVRRLMPALGVLLVTYTAVLAAQQRLTVALLGRIWETAGYATNMAYLWGFPTERGLQHTWSLAVEEQFYLLWPLLLIVVLRARQRVALMVVLALTTAVTAEMWVHSRNPHVLAWSHTRGVGLAVGCAAALLVSLYPRRARWVAQVGCLLAIPVIATILFSRMPQGLLLKGLLLLFVAGWACVIVAGLDGPLSRVLAVAPLAWVGRISYSLYLWHVPVLAAFGWPVGLRALPALIVTFVMAAASYYFVEQRFRRPRQAGDETAPGTRRAAPLAQPS